LDGGGGLLGYSTITTLDGGGCLLGCSTMTTFGSGGGLGLYFSTITTYG